MAAAALGISAAAAAVPAADATAEAARALERGDGIAAEVAARRALDAGTPREELAALIGEAELLQGDRAEARAWLAPGKFSAATNGRGFHALGRLEMAEGNLDGAAAAFDRALALGGASARLWVDIGRLRYRAGQHHLAPDASRRARAVDPDEPRALEFEAQLVRDAEGVVAALPWFERALDIAPDDLGLLGEYAATLGEAGRHRDMLRVARRMVEIDPRHPRAYFLQSVLAARAGHDDLARRLLARTGGAYDDVPAGRLLAGVLELGTGNAALAIGRFDALARHQPDNEAARLLLARALLAHGEGNEVIARFGAAADRREGSPYLLSLVGRAYEQAGRREEAARYLDRAGGSAADAPGVLLPPAQASAGAAADVAQARRLLAEGRLAEAASLGERLRGRFPDSVDVEILAGDIALLGADAAGALALYRSAAEVRRDFALVERLVASQLRLGREDAAIAELGDFLARNPRSAPAAAMLGRMMARSGDERRAEALLAYAGALGGDGRGPAPGGSVAATLARLGE